MYELARGWETTLRKDLAGFADRGEPPVVEREKGTLRAEWAVRGKKRSEIFGLNPEGALRWVSGPSEDESYADFLTSEDMADFRQFADAIARAIPRLPEFVPSDATVDAGFDAQESIAAEAGNLARLADQGRAQAEGRTSLLFLKGDPGAGKTTLLREATTAQAERYLARESDFLLFYVSAQGRELSNLRDAFSGELQDLRAGFTRDAISALVRTGLLVPVVDAFDELLGTAGYGGAFSSLQTLLADLEGLGAVVVSARSAFYDLEFLGRASSPANQADISVTTVSLQPWTDEQLRQYLTRGGEDGTLDALERLDQEDRQLLRRPFFANKFPDFTARAGEEQHAGNLLEFLITAYIEREAEKIVDASGDPVLPVDGHRQLFEVAAGEMWEAEARQLSLDDLRTLTEVVAEEFELGADEAAQLSAKVTSYAGFSPGSSGGRDDFSFEHEVYFDYFLARALERLLQEARVDDLMVMLDRGIVPEGVARNAMASSRDQLGSDPALLRCAAGPRYDNRRRNLGAIAVAYAREVRPLEDADVSQLSFIDLSFGDSHYKGVRFVGCTFTGVDLSGAVFEACTADSSTTLHAVTLDNESRIGIEGLRPGHNVGSVRHPAAGDVYAPRDVQKVLERLGAPGPGKDERPSYSDKAQVLINLLQRAARAYRRTNILYENDAHLEKLFGSDYWLELRRLLLESGVVTEEIRQASGPKGTAYRLQVGVDQLLVGQSGNDVASGPATELWRSLREL